MSIIHKGGMDPAEFVGRTMYRVMETKQMQKEAEYSVEDRVKERPAGPKLRDRSEGGPGRGYYLNGVFHPYSEEEDN